MEVISATNGRQAIELIQSTPDIGVVLMDIMMPEMDGYETMQEIRRDPKFGALPMLALTAKAMKGDREKCLEAGASDYIAKPVNTNNCFRSCAFGSTVDPAPAAVLPPALVPRITIPHRSPNLQSSPSESSHQHSARG